jgi:hypothetical protein
MIEVIEKDKDYSDVHDKSSEKSGQIDLTESCFNFLDRVKT